MDSPSAAEQEYKPLAPHFRLKRSFEFNIYDHQKNIKRILVALGPPYTHSSFVIKDSHERRTQSLAYELFAKLLPTYVLPSRWRRYSPLCPYRAF